MSQQFESIAIGIASSSTIGFRSAELAALAYCIILPTFVICQGRGAAVKVQYNVLQLRPSMPRHCHGQYARISSFSILHERPGLQPKQSHICACVCVLYAHLLTYIISYIYIYTYVYMFWIPVTDLEAVYIHADIHIDIRSVIKYCSQHGGLPKTRFSQTARSAI